jgi:hypothetical protein
MDKEEIKDYILKKIDEINEFQPEDYLKVVRILREVRREYLRYESKEYLTELKKALLEKEKPIMKDSIDNEIKFLEDKVDGFQSANFFQTKTLLAGVIFAVDY